MLPPPSSLHYPWPQHQGRAVAMAAAARPDAPMGFYRGTSTYGGTGPGTGTLAAQIRWTGSAGAVLGSFEGGGGRGGGDDGRSSVGTVAGTEGRVGDAE